MGEGLKLDPGLTCWFTGSSWWRDPDGSLGIATEVWHRSLTVELAAGDATGHLSWGGYEAEENIDNLEYDILGRLTRVVPGKHDKYAEAYWKVEERKIKAREDSEWATFARGPLTRILVRAQEPESRFVE